MASTSNSSSSSTANINNKPIMSPPSSSMPTTSNLFPRQPFFTRLSLFFRVWSFKTFVFFGLRLLRLTKRAQIQSVAATYTKTYPSCPGLECRVFLPPSVSSTPASSSSTEESQPQKPLLPLYINIHGGGFAIGDPQIDDAFAHHFSSTHNIVVVSINYYKAPLYPFPSLLDSAAALTRAVLDDKSLPVDTTKVATGGFSAGGNICLAVAQYADIRSRVKALVPIYPVVDFSGRYKGEYKPNREGKRDALEGMAGMFNWAYLNPGQDQRDPLLSPIYAKREDLPGRIFFVGAQYDVLCREAEVMARKMAGWEDGEVERDLGVEGEGWEKEGMKWKMISDVQHGFTHVEATGEKEVERKKVCDGLYLDMAVWLRKVWDE